MSHVQESALFEVLNAKRLTPAEIAASFVVPPQFEQLVSPDHSFLVGPRGSGKTTLLRMLQGQALTTWSHERAEHYRRRVRYSSVFLPADRLWSSQVAPSTGEGSLGVAAFTSQMLYALVETMLYRTGGHSGDQILHRAKLSHRAEVDLVAECAAAWKLSPRSGSLQSLQGALDLRLTELAELIENGDPGRPSPDFFRTVPLEAFAFGIRSFNRHAREPEHRWALLLDEMELAPPSVHRALRASLRGSERLLILKLSFSPLDRYIGSESHGAPGLPDNDFRPIYLWYGNRIGSRRFSRGLWRRIMLEATGESRPALAVLGTSDIDSSGSTWRNSAYKPGSRQLTLMRKMARQDSGFRAYLRKHSIDLGDVDSMSYERRSATLRKVYPLLVFRDAILSFERGEPRRRQRKSITECYTGSDAVFAALEGNPRWIKAVVSSLLNVYDRGTQIPRGYQYERLVEAANRFEALLRVLPAPGLGRSTSVLSLVDDIASYFSYRAFGPFTADPPATFRVDDQVPGHVVAALETALSAGAIVHLRNQRSPVVLSSLIGERFRLAYLLAVREGMEFPLRLGKTTSLSTILSWADRRRAAIEPIPAPTLWESS